MKKRIWIIILIVGMLLAGVRIYLLFEQPSEKTIEPPMDEQPIEKEEDKKLKEQITRYQLEDYQSLIYENQELFQKYVEVVENNERIKPYEFYVMNIFPIVASHKQYLEPDFFLEKLAKLNIYIEPNLMSGNNIVNGVYRDNLTQVALNRWQEDTMHENDILVLYHELMHFLDWNMNSSRDTHSNYTCYCKDQTYNYEQYNKLSEEEKDRCKCIFNPLLKMMTEGGADTWMGRYFNDGKVSAYQEYALCYEILNALVGVDTVNEMFLTSNHANKLYEILVINNAISEETYYALIKYLSMDNLVNENRVYFIDTCITIYEQIYKIKWYEDKVFSYLMLNYIRDFIPINYLFNSPNTKDYKNYYYTNYININNSITETIEDGKYRPYSQPFFSHFNNENRLILYVEYNEQDQRKYGNLFVDYDFDNNKIIHYQFKPDA